MRFINVAHKYINNIDVENTMKLVSVCSIENVFLQTTDLYKTSVETYICNLQFEVGASFSHTLPKLT